MNFNTALFLFLFLPVFLIVYLLGQRRWRPVITILGSILFYAWGQAANLPIILGLILINYWAGLRLKGSRPKLYLYGGMALNLAVLLFFKLLVTYGTGVLLGLGKYLPESLDQYLTSLTFPLGLSYISFQVISYLIDVHKGTVQPEKKLLDFASYILMFPKLLAGPIVRYRSLVGQLSEPQISAPQIASGIRRLILGLAKKVLIADVLGKVVNAVFNLSIANISPVYAWIALPAYTLQIYFDFSGFTDMAVGLASIMGLRFPENFNYPYMASGVGDFWRRWHITLSTWFRDYVFFPLERGRIPVVGQVINILIVFLLTGLWHGLAPTFIIWGLLHGLFISLENLFLNRWLLKPIPFLGHVYTLGVLLLTWLVFRSPNLGFAWGYLQRLAGNVENLTPLAFTETTPLPFIEPTFILAFVSAVLLSLPVFPLLKELINRLVQRFPAADLPLVIGGDAVLLLLFVLSIGMMAASKFLPGIYGSF